MNFLAFIEPGDLFNFMISLVVEHLGWVISPYTTLFAVKLANGTVIHTTSIASRLVLNGVW